MSTSPEKLPFSPENREVSKEALEQLGQERREQLHEALERGEAGNESSPEKVHSIRAEALEHADSAEKASQHEVSPAERRTRGPIGKKERDASFSATMNEVRGHMNAPSRTFSKVIHVKVVEKASEAVGSTVARPNAILAGAAAAFAVTLVVYLVAKNYGYPLSGSESLLAFAAGWLLGLLYDFLRVMITGRK